MVLSVGALCGVTPAFGQAAGGDKGAPNAPSTAAPTAATASTGIPAKDTLLKMTKRLTVDFTEQRLEDVLGFVVQVTGVDAEIMWLEGGAGTGLEKDTQISLKVNNMSALSVLEKVLEKAQAGGLSGGGNTWQLSENGTLQIGPRERLNTYKRIVLYSVADLLQELPDYEDAPEFDLQSVLQNSGQRGGGGGGQSPFRDNQGNQGATDRRTLAQRAEDLQRLITNIVERDQWQENGGTGASITYYQGSFLVNAPDYVHRELNGYPWWSDGSTYKVVDGRRYVSMNMNTSINKIREFRNVPITGVVPGRGGGGGGGGNPPPPPPPGGGG